nr:GNAT family N-acetyltransferase [uncultured Pseudogulbenkiania sp.]
MSYPIRRADVADAPALLALFSCPSVVRNSLQLPYPSLSHWQTRLAELPDSTHALVACDAEDRAIAYGAVMRPPQLRRAHTASLALAVHEDWQGKGVGRRLLGALLEYADNWLGLTRLELHVYADNERAIALYRLLGFEEEGRLRADSFRDGEFVDGLLMARLCGPLGGRG